MIKNTRHLGYTLCINRREKAEDLTMLDFQVHNAQSADRTMIICERSGLDGRVRPSTFFVTILLQNKPRVTRLGVNHIF